MERGNTGRKAARMDGPDWLQSYTEKKQKQKNSRVRFEGLHMNRNKRTIFPIFFQV